MPKSLKILHLASWYPNSVDPQQGIFIKHQIDALGSVHTNTLITLRVGTGFTCQVKDEAGFKHYQYSYNPKSFGFKRLSWYRAWHKIMVEFTHRKFDCIHLHVVYPMGIIALKWANKFKLPLVVSEHWTGYGNPNLKLGIYQKRVVKQVLNKAKKVAVVSSYLQQNMELYAKGNFAIIPNIVHFESEIEVKKVGELVTFMNISDHSDEHKNISGILKAFKELLNDYSNCRLVLVGSGRDTKILQELATKLQLDNKVEWKGRLTNSEVLKLIPECDFGIVNSNFETFSITAFEFLAAQKPLIITKCGGPEDFLPQEAVIQIPVNSSKHLLEAMKQFMEVPDRSTEIASNKVREQFSELAFVNRWNVVYNQLFLHAE